MRRFWLRAVFPVFLLGMLFLPLLSGCAREPRPPRDLQAERTLDSLQRSLRAIEAKDIAQ